MRKKNALKKTRPAGTAGSKKRLSSRKNAPRPLRPRIVEALVVSNERDKKPFPPRGLENSYHTIVENMIEGAVILDSNGMIVFANASFTILAGRRTSSLAGALFTDFLPVPFHEKFSAFLDKCTIRPHRDEFTITYVHGSVLQVSISGSAYETNGIKYICLIISDLSERKEAELKLRIAYEEVEKKAVERTMELRESEERYKAITSNTPDHILVQDRDLRYQLVVNPQLGLTENEMIGKTDYEILTKEDADNISKIKRRVVETDTPVHFEAPLIDREGNRQFFEGSYIPKHDAQERVDGLIGYFRNVTERKLAEEALLESRKQIDFLANIIESSSQPFGVGYPDGRLGLFNKAFEQLTGYSGDELRIIDWARVLTPKEWVEIEQKKLAELHETGVPVRYEKEYIRKDGTRVPIELLVHLVKDADGKSLYYYSFLTDITERKKAEGALRESELRYRDLFNSLIEGYCIVEMVFDSDGKPVDYRFLEVNEAFESQTGLYDAQGKLMRDLAPGHEQHWFDIYGKIALTGEPAHFMNEARALNRWFDVQAFRLGGRESRRIAICFSDITERKKAEEALRRSNEISSAILNATTETLWLMDLEGNILGANETAAKRLGKTVAEVIGKNGFVLTPPYVKELRQAKILEMAQTGKSVQFQDERDGIIFHHTFYPVRDALGAVKGLVSFSRDITEQKRAEEALKESEERFKAIALTTPVGIGVVDASKAVFLYINPAYEKAFGYAESELLGRKTPDIYWSAEDREKILGILKEKAQVAEYEVKLKRKDGTSFWGLSSVRPIIYGGRPALLGAFVDITDRKNAEERLLQNTVELRRSNEELERFNRAMVGRELRMVELKKQVNELCSKLGEPRRFKMDTDGNE